MRAWLSGRVPPCQGGDRGFESRRPLQYIFTAVMASVRSLLKSKINLILILLFVLSLVLRFVNLGYSDYQGDETKALYTPKNQNLSQFLMSQKKGPMQFLVTKAVKPLSNNYDNTGVARLPFALAGFTASIYFYLFVKKILNEKVALYASLFFITNGLFVAFSRIVQYQALVLLFSTASLYYASLFYYSNKPKYIYLSLAIWTLGIFSHTDSIFVLPVLATLLISWWVKYKVAFARVIKLFLPIFLVIAVVVGGYYFALINNATNETKAYWMGRFTGEATEGLTSTPIVFNTYQPIFGYPIYEFLGLIALFLWGYVLVDKITFFRRLGVFPSVSITTWIGITGWLLCAFLFMEKLTMYPGTHIWTYILPLCVLIGFGFYALEYILPKFAKWVLYVLIAGLFAFLYIQSFLIFVDHKYEYPWEPKKVMLWTVKMPPSNYQVTLFGFPYYRNWRGVRDFLKADGRQVAFVSNERNPITTYYMPYERSSSKAGYIVWISRPQSSTSLMQNRRAAIWVDNYAPLKVFVTNDRNVAKLYYMPENWTEADLVLKKK